MGKRPARFRYIRLSMRTLLILIAVMGMWLGHRVNQARRQKAAIHSICGIGDVYYDYEIENSMINPVYPTSIPRWLSHLLGDDFFYRVKWVDFSNNDYGSPVATDTHLRQIRTLKSVEVLWIDDTCQITDTGLAHLTELVNLKVLDVDNSRISSAALRHIEVLKNLENLRFSSTRIAEDGLERLSNLPNLSVLNLSSTRVTDEGIDHLLAIKNLRRLYLVDTEVTDDGVRKIKAALPNCEIHTEHSGVIPVVGGWQMP